MATMSGLPLLGLCPIGKFVFSHEEALRQKFALADRLTEWGIRFVNLDGVIPDGMVRAQSQVDAVVAHFTAKQIDCLFLPHCNFGTEGAVGMIARKLNLPTLLWGPRDDAPQPDGTRLRDSLCGMLASSKVLHKLGVPFTYIENCRLDDPPLRAGVDRFLRAASAASVLTRGVRIGLIGQRIDFFWSTIVNESELLERFNVEVLPIDLVTFIKHAKARAAAGAAAYARECAALRHEWTIEGFENDEKLINILAVRDQMLALAADEKLDAVAMQDFMSLVDEMGAWCFLADSFVGNQLPVAIESDIHGAISSLLVRRAIFNQQPDFLTDIAIRHPTNDNAVLLWHAGAPLSLKHPQSKIRLGTHWILPAPVTGMPHFRLKDGPITIARFDGDQGQYQLAIGQGHSTDGPPTQTNYLWIQVDNWARWERMLMQGPFIHHVAMAYSHVGAALVEACKYIPGLKPVRLNELELQ
jgi:L-fucose isomerase-like protein